MGVLNNKKTDEAAAPKKTRKPTGYDRPLFEDHREHKTDDRMFGGDMDKKESMNHDQKVAEKIVNGMCVDFFFRAEDIDSPKFKEVPESNEPVTESQKRPTATGKITTKPLDTGKYNRSYIIGTEPEEKPPARPKRKRKPRKRRPRARGARGQGSRTQGSRARGSRGKASRSRSPRSGSSNQNKPGRR